MSIKPKECTIAEQWRAFEELILAPSGAPPIQVKEMRRAFYSGFEAALRVEWAIGDESISEEAAMGILTGLREEAMLFAKQIAQGEA